MPAWNLGHGDPLTLGLVCDARLTKPEYGNDHIWETRLGGGEPPALAVETTFGLRARLMRIFPRFTEGSSTISDPVLFSASSRVHQFYPNYLKLSFSPYSGVDVVQELWVPTSTTLAGRLLISNNSILPRSLRFELAALLVPLGDGQGMTPHRIEANSILMGQTSGLSPVLFLSGGAEPGMGSFPSLALELNLLPGNKRQVSWGLASIPGPEASFELARQTANRSWEAELARLELMNRMHTLEIHTGNPDWNAIFALSQKAAHSLVMGPEPGLPAPSFVLSRRPNHGFSERADGKDADQLWSGQTVMDAYALSNLVLPGSVELLKGILVNFLSTEGEEGFIDWKPGLRGQRGHLLAQPLLASLAWRIYQQSQDQDFLRAIFEPLLRFNETWFSQECDRDQDGFPEWGHVLQTGFEESLLFNRLIPNAQGVDVTAVEDPALGAFLVRECSSLIQIAHLLGRSEMVKPLQERLKRLSAGVETCWNPTNSSYRPRDRDTHQSSRGRILGRFQGSSVQNMEENFDPPSRLIVQIQVRGELMRSPLVTITGRTPRGKQEETYTTRKLMGSKYPISFTSQNVYTRLDQLEITGLEPNDQVTLRTIDFSSENLTQMMPLWAGIPSPERAEKLIRRTLLNPDRYGLPYGVPAHPKKSRRFSPAVHLFWNTLLVEGLLAYGYRVEAVELFNKIMAGTLRTVKKEAAFREVYSALEETAAGEIDPLRGLVPVGLFMEILGVKIVSPERVILQGNNPFPWVITVKYRGLSVIRQKEQTLLTFPEGQTTTVRGPGPHLVSLS